ncbi:MAG: DUF3999 family protein [Burkholderiaceae bacterium]
MTQRPSVRRALAWGLALAAAWPLAAHAQASADTAPDRPAQYTTRAELHLAEGEGLQRVVLPLDVLRALQRADGEDLRVFNARGEPVPQAWAGVPQAETAPPALRELPRFAWPEPVRERGDDLDVDIELGRDGSLLRLRRQGRPLVSTNVPAGTGLGSCAWLLDLAALGPQPPRVDRLQLDGPTPAGGLVLPLQVDASADAQRWTAVGRGTLVDLAGDGGAACRSASWRWTRCPPHALPARARRAGLGADACPRRDAGRQPRRAAAAQPRAAGARGGRPDGDVWRLDLHARLSPRAMQLHLPVDNQVLPLSVEAGGVAGSPADAWHPLAQHTAYRLTRAGRLIESPEFALPALAATRWRFVPDARGRWPADAPAPEVTVAWRAPQLLFAAQGPAPFTLAAGRAAARPVALERATLMPGYQGGGEFALPEATLGPLQTQAVAEPGWREQLADASPQQRRRWWLWAALTLAVGALAALAWRLMREVGRAPGGPT